MLEDSLILHAAHYQVEWYFFAIPHRFIDLVVEGHSRRHFVPNQLWLLVV